MPISLSLHAVNEPRSSRYQRTRRRTAAAGIVTTVLLLATLLLTNGSARLRDIASGTVPIYVCLLAALNGAVTLPFAWYRSYHLERVYALSQPSIVEWCRDYAKAAAVSLGLAIVAAGYVYMTLRLSPDWWWLFAAGGGATLLTLSTMLGPVCVLPIFHSSRPLGDRRLQQRLIDLSARAGVSVLSVHEWALGEKTRRVNAALVGAGTTRRILLSDTLLAEYSEDEIEVVLAHEIGHHVHSDVMKSLAVEFLVLVAAAYAASVVLNVFWKPLGFRSGEDDAALRLMVLAAGGVLLTATPLLNAWSRHNERRADQFALQLTARPDAFIAAMRRMAAQNMADERPTLAARWFFDTHPSVEERIGRARQSMETIGRVT